ncbi:nucleotidyl transferase AbiEii/AbiGii toxin family protein [bacterium]|nr:nucleotidyl transferase AbiEii/AbiGii toxin family protein [bacterium]
MTAEDRVRLQASIRQRLLNIAQREGADFQLVLTRYGLERFLYRLGRSPHRSAFLLKGAFLFYAWQQEVGRPTRDLDFLGHGVPNINRLTGVVAEIIAEEVDDDGLDFLPDTIEGEAIREASLYDGIRVRLVSTLGRTRIPVQIDIGFGDAAGPRAVELAYPTLLNQDPPWILTYRPEFVVAENLEAMVAFGDINTRLKDYYDLWRMSRTMELPRENLVEALRATFLRRGTAIPGDVPPGLADDFADPRRTLMWDTFITRNGLDAEGISLVDVVAELRSYYWPMIFAASLAE